MLSYQELVIPWRKGMRNENWRRLGLMERIFYRAAMFYAKMRNWIINSKIIAKVREIAKKLGTSIRDKIMDLGSVRAKEMLIRFKEKRILKWAPEIRAWLSDENYVFWLGLSSQTPYIRIS